jgi:hypothetical protein
MMVMKTIWPSGPLADQLYREFGDVTLAVPAAAKPPSIHSSIQVAIVWVSDPGASVAPKTV